MNMSCSEEEETFRPEEGKPSAGGSEAFRPDPGSSVSKGQTLPERVSSAASSCGSMKSDRSKGQPENFRSGPGCSDPRGQMLPSVASSCGSMKSDRSKGQPENFRSGSSDPKAPPLTQGGRPATVICESLKSNKSREYIINFPHDPGSLKSRKRTRRDVTEEEPSSFCILCQDVLKDPVSTSCGHWFCRGCITSHWDQSAGSGVRSCPLCGSTFITDVGLQELLDEHRISLKGRYEHTTEESGKEMLLNRIYTELYITEGLREDVQTQHEARQMETSSKTNRLHDAPIRNQDILKPLPDQHGPIRVVLTSGVAGAGKSFSVQKFTLDWAEGSENQDISAVVPLSFRELNLIRDEQHSLLTLIQRFHPTFQKIPAEQLSVCKLLFIFDGLDESRLSLDFSNSQVVSDVTQKSSINLLLINLIQGRLLPSALVWITSRPAAANQIPPSCVDRLTEVRGFNDAQKEEYFRRRFPDEELSSRIFSHIKSSMSLYIMCEVPVFCYITAVVLENMLTTEQRGELPTTLTDMYSHFVMVQTKRKKKYKQEHEKTPQELAEADREVLLKLGDLAFEHLEKGNIMFYQEDLQQCGLDVTEASVYSGVCTEIFRRECEIFQKPVYSFVHLSVQEFLAAVYMFHCYTNKNTEVMEDFLEDQRNISSLDEFLRKVMEMSLQSKAGHLDLCVRFLHGLSVESNQRLLGGLLGQTENSPETIQRIINNLKMVQKDDELPETESLPWQMMSGDKISPDRRINIFHCLMEMKELSVDQDIQEFMKSENKSEKRLSEIHCSGLAYKLQISEEVLEELDLDTYNTTNEGRRRLIPAVRNCKKFRLTNCGLSETDCGVVALALKSNPSHLTELDLSKNQLKPSAVELLCAGLQSPNCRLQILRLVRCSLLKNSCAALISALKSNPSHLIELDVSNCDLHDSGLILLSSFVESPQCRLQILRLERSTLSDVGFIALGSALQNNPSHLTELDLSMNKNLQDPGLIHLCDFLKDPRCHLQVLRLRGCDFTAISCKALASALKSNPSHLAQLDLRDNYLEDSDVQQLQDLLESPDFQLQTLSTESW
ncbi:NLR family CARD domain-containing protein 3 isoform X2 [Oryzias melastigma]|uniref:NLR family CARD domain-containing protein 3 isoform X2 n=1 Tax=Oryzias melastigma TaxID=30732 RepID=UPI000CF83368|nr:NLR family CARD domain-containing protein 3 isoform X2 [Oryzias melastigma]